MALVQFDKKDGSEPLSTLTLAGVAEGNTLIVDVHISGSAAVVGTVSIADDVDANPWSQDASQVTPAGDNANQLLRFRKAAVAADDYTITVSATGSGYVSAIAHEWDGDLQLHASIVQGDASGNNVSGTYTSATLTTTIDDCTIIATVGTDTTPPSGFAPGAGETEVADHNARIQTEYKAAATAGGYTMAWALGAGSTDCCYIIGAYYTPSGGGGSAGLLIDPLGLNARGLSA